MATPAGERLNVFLAWLNLENSFGSEEAMGEVLREALQCCDQYKVGVAGDGRSGRVTITYSSQQWYYLDKFIYLTDPV